MRTLIAMMLLAACAKDGASSAGGSAGSGSAAASGSAVTGGSAVAASSAAASGSQIPAGAFAMTGVRLLEPESVIEHRIANADKFGDLLKDVVRIVSELDAKNPGKLPAQVDAVVVARAKATRVWLVGPTGDLAAPGLDSEIAKLPPAPVTDRHVAAIVSLARPGAVPPTSTGSPHLPAAWTAAAGPGDGADIDDVIDKVWPR